MKRFQILVSVGAIVLAILFLTDSFIFGSCPGSMFFRRSQANPEPAQPNNDTTETKKEEPKKTPEVAAEPKKEEPKQESSTEATPTAISAVRPPLGSGLQPRITSLRTLANSDGQIMTLAGMVEPWEVWWTLNRDKFLNFRQPITWVTVKESEGSRSVIILPIYKELLEILKSALNERDYTLVWNAALALGRCGDPEAIPLLQKAFNDTEHPLVKNYTLVSLGWIRDPSAVDFLAGKLTDKKTQEIVRSHAAVGLAYINEPGSLKALNETINEKEYRKQADVVCAAAYALGLLKDNSAVKTLAAYLSGELKSDTRIRSYAALALGHIGSKDAFQELKKSAGDKDRGVRTSVAIALGLMEEPKAKDELLNMLQDKDEVIRGMAALALAESTLKYPDKAHSQKMVSDNILKCFGNCKRDGQGLTIIALGILGESKIKPELRKMLEEKRKPRAVKGAAIMAYGLLKDKEAVPLLMDLLKTTPDDPILAPYAILALGMIGDEKAVASIQPLWDRVDKNVSAVAYSNMAVSLSMLGKRKEVLDQLVKHSVKGQSDTLRQYSLHTLGLLADKEAAQAFVEAYKEGDTNAKANAVVGIGLLMEKNSIPLVTQWLADNNTDIFTWIIDHLLPIPTW
ncbi:MAG: HEAT repeat domain-containing protein [Candidatus Brocadiia bacterium]